MKKIMAMILAKKRNNKPQGFYVGGIGRGKAYHPWDYLPKCTCGGYPYMVSQNDECYKSGEPNRIYCLQCGKSTAFGTVLDIRKEWAKMNLDKDTYMSMEDLIELRYRQ